VTRPPASPALDSVIVAKAARRPYHPAAVVRSAVYQGSCRVEQAGKALVGSAEIRDAVRYMMSTPDVQASGYTHIHNADRIAPTIKMLDESSGHAPRYQSVSSRPAVN
jgi:hypothetical protein